MDILSDANLDYNQLVKPIIYSETEEILTDNFGINRMGHIFLSVAENDLWLQKQTNEYISPKFGVQQREISVPLAPYNIKVYLTSALTYSNWLNFYINYSPDGVSYARPTNPPDPPSKTKLNNFKFWMRTNIAVEIFLSATGFVYGPIECQLYADFYDALGILQSTKRLDEYHWVITDTTSPPASIILQGDIIYPLNPAEGVRFYIINTMPISTPPNLQGYMEHQELSEQDILTQVY
ncbi:MAG: hypothetical protein ABFD61_02705 [Chloroherpetonaceae bacterium]